MPIKKFYATKDTTITNAYNAFKSRRCENANMGASDSLEIFSIFGNVSPNSLESSRILIDFNNQEILNSKDSLNSDNIKYYLKLYNVTHPYSLPKDFTVSVQLVNKNWDEGYGLDMETYSDLGYPAGYGATWLSASKNQDWTLPGGDTIPGFVLSQSFPIGTEDLEIEITDLVYNNNLTASNGFLINLSGAYEDGSLNTSFYTKKFSARGTEFFFGQPCVEARWEPSIKDDRKNFFAYSPFAPAEDNTMNLYYYNKINNKLVDIPNDPEIDVKFYADQTLQTEITPESISTSKAGVGTYLAQVTLDTTASVVYDQWAFDTYEAIPNLFSVYKRENNLAQEEYTLSIKNLKSKYKQDEQARFNLSLKQKNFSLNVYSKVFEEQQSPIIKNLFYKISRPYDNYIILDYSTGSLAYTQVSYDSSGNYVDLHMNLFEKNYLYNIQFATWDGENLVELSEIFKFRVE